MHVLVLQQLNVCLDFMLQMAKCPYRCRSCTLKSCMFYITSDDRSLWHCTDYIEKICHVKCRMYISLTFLYCVVLKWTNRFLWIRCAGDQYMTQLGVVLMICLPDNRKSSVTDNLTWVSSHLCKDREDETQYQREWTSSLSNPADINCCLVEL